MIFFVLSLILQATQTPAEAVSLVEQFELPLNFFTPDMIIIRKSSFKKQEIYHIVFSRGHQKSIPQVMKKSEFNSFKEYLYKLDPTKQANACSRFLDVREFSNKKYRNIPVCVRKSKDNTDFEKLVNNLIKKYKR